MTGLSIQERLLSLCDIATNAPTGCAEGSDYAVEPPTIPPCGRTLPQSQNAAQDAAAPIGEI